MEHSRMSKNTLDIYLDKISIVQSVSTNKHFTQNVAHIYRCLPPSRMWPLEIAVWYIVLKFTLIYIRNVHLNYLKYEIKVIIIAFILPSLLLCKALFSGRSVFVFYIYMDRCFMKCHKQTIQCPQIQLCSQMQAIIMFHPEFYPCTNQKKTI